MSRRRYDTQALVGDIRRERRHAVLLASLGIAILAFLVYYFAKIREPSVPEVPESVTATTAAAAAPAPAPAPSPAEQPAPAPTAASRAPAEAVVEITLPRPGPLYIDGELVAKKTREHQTTLAPGKHKIATRIGRRNVQLGLEAAAGKRYRVDLDPRKKKGGVEEVR